MIAFWTTGIFFVVVFLGALTDWPIFYLVPMLSGHCLLTRPRRGFVPLVPLLAAASLLFVAGIYAHEMSDQTHEPGIAHQFLKLVGMGNVSNYWLDLLVLIGLFSIAGILGNTVGYWFGRRIGPAMYNWRDRFLFKKRYLYQAHEFYEKHAAGAIVAARFIPIIRTFAPIVAGIVDMDRKKFSFFNIIGCIAWIFSMIAGGFFLQKWMKAEFDKKMSGPDSMGELWTDDFFDILPGGKVVNKQEMMELMGKADRQPGTGAFPDNFKLRAVYGNVALATDHTTIKGVDANGKIVVVREMGVLRMFVKEKGKWRVAGAGLVPIAAQ